MQTLYLRFLLSAVIALASAAGIPAFGQSASTGALTGTVVDPAGALAVGAVVRLSAVNSGVKQSVSAGRQGRFDFRLLPPGTYKLEAHLGTSGMLVATALINVAVTETVSVELQLYLEPVVSKLEVFAESASVHTENSSVGRTFGQAMITGLPLVSRNFAQLVVLSPGVSSGVNNAGELGLGGTALSQIGKSNDGIYVHGARSYDNNFQLDGISVSDVQGSGSISGGIPAPNPDALEEFKAQTGLYDAAFGRATGANISIVTRTGSNRYHASVFEFLRNQLLNANDFFFNETGQHRPDLKQNQFGVSVGGPVRKDRLLFFASYQGTRQINGIASGQPRVACTASVSLPPLTNDRSRTALGQIFGDMSGALGGTAVTPDGSNINPVALALLNFKLPDGSFLIPTPQTINPSQPIASRGFSTFTQPCGFQEDQGVGSIDYFISQKSRLAARAFVAVSDQLVTFPGGALNPTDNSQGFASASSSQFLVLSLSHTYAVNNDVLNELRIGAVHTMTKMRASAPFKWSDVGVAESELNADNELPNLDIAGSISMATVVPRTYDQVSLVANDVVSVVKGGHSFRFGGSITRLADDLAFEGAGSDVHFLSWPDFLLGLSASQNGTGEFSNVFASTDVFGVFNRQFRVWEESAFAQDDVRLGKRFNLNLGLRFERPGQFGDALGRTSSFDISKADRNPPPGGSLAGYMVASNFSGTLPPGVTRANNTFGNYGEGQNTLAPRLGFAWQMFPQTSRFVLRGAYGIYHSRPTGQTATQSVLAAPFSLTRASTGLANASATFQEPFAQPFPTGASFPMFVPYSATSNIGINALAPDFRPAAVQELSLALQTELHGRWMLQVGYVGTHGTQLQRYRSLNQALDASTSNPVNGVTSNTLLNIGLRVPVPGVRPDALREMESGGKSWYHGLETSLTKRFASLELLASYTFSKTLDTDGADVNSISSTNALTLGDQNNPAQRWGRASFDRRHRLVVSGTWSLPAITRYRLTAISRGWTLAAVATLQSGTALTIADTNSTNVFGITEDRAQLTGTCARSQLVTPGPTESKLNNYFNRSCFTTPPVIGADGLGTDFGDSPTGMVDGPGQENLDLALTRQIGIRWPAENGALELRAEFYNALNHPQFSAPDANFTSPTFGVISSTAVNARVGQLAMKFMF